jgi:hypothetical protein
VTLHESTIEAQFFSLLALSWRNLPCALKPAIGSRKRTLGNPRQSVAPHGPQQALGANAHPCAVARPVRRNSNDFNGVSDQHTSFAPLNHQNNASQSDDAKAADADGNYIFRDGNVADTPTPSTRKSRTDSDPCDQSAG